MPDDDEIFRLQIAQALAREPPRAELEVDLAARILRWLRTSDDRLLQPEIQPFPTVDKLAAPVHPREREGTQMPPHAEGHNRYRVHLSDDAADGEETGLNG